MTIRVIFTNDKGKLEEVVCETMTQAVEIRNQRRAEGRSAHIYHS
jgi:hypothetical protein